MRFLLDVMCGGLVPYLRMCNHDTAYAGDRDLEADDAVLDAAREEGRTLVTRDVALANRATDSPGSIPLESREVEGQLAELAAAGVSLTLADEPRFCGRCNGPLERADPDAEGDELPEYVPGGSTSRRADSSDNESERPAGEGRNGEHAAQDRPSDLWRCPDCGQYFWRGSHWDRVAATLEEVRRGTDGSAAESDG